MREENSLEKTYLKPISQVSDLLPSVCVHALPSTVCVCVSLSPPADLFEVTLWKKGKDNKNFLKRVFLLSRSDFTLRYFVKEDVKCLSAL